MGFLSRNEPMIPKNATFRLTQDGQERLMSFAGSAQDKILCALETCGSSNRDEIAKASGLSKGAVERLLLTLCQKGYIQRVGGSSDYTPLRMEEG